MRHEPWMERDERKPPPLSAEELAEAMRLAADEIMRADGDRDYMNPSNLKVQQTTAVADIMRLAAIRIEALAPAKVTRS